MDRRRLGLGLIAATCGLVVSACAMAHDVRLRHPDGRTAVCVPGWRYGVIGATLGHDHVRDCVEDYRQQGYERVP